VRPPQWAARAVDRLPTSADARAPAPLDRHMTARRGRSQRRLSQKRGGAIASRAGGPPSEEAPPSNAGHLFVGPNCRWQRTTRH
jgi:hypothetical protein